MRGPAGGIQVPGRSISFIEVIRFAASNHLVIELDYIDEQGLRRTRPIEPYSLRQTQAGDIQEVRLPNNQSRSKQDDPRSVVPSHLLLRDLSSATNIP
jgi:hypothetical protein